VNDGALALQTVDAIAVEGLPDDYPAPFEVQLRSSEILQYPCDACHRDPLPALPEDPSLVDSRSMHVDVPEAHAGPSIMTCRGCHDAQNLNRLVLNDGSTVGFDHAYRLCSQCHFEQGRDWIGGAHGKRLATWQGRRVVQNCTGCHDPHEPTIESKWPVTYPRIPRVEVSR